MAGRPERVTIVDWVNLDRMKFPRAQTLESPLPFPTLIESSTLTLEIGSMGTLETHQVMPRLYLAKAKSLNSTWLTVRTDTAFVQARSTAALPTFRNCVVQNSWCIRCLCFGRLPSSWAIKNICFPPQFFAGKLSSKLYG